MQRQLRLHELAGEVEGAKWLGRWCYAGRGIDRHKWRLAEAIVRLPDGRRVAKRMEVRSTGGWTIR